jgi:hypothetical protein
LDWWLLRDWGMPHEGGWLEWPAREFAGARVARNVHIAMSGFRDARNVVEWCNSNPRAWELVSRIMAMKQENATHARQ